MLRLLQAIDNWLRPFIEGDRPIYTMTKRELLYAKALASCGTDASPNDLAPDELGCAETVNEIHKGVFGDYISPRNILSTYQLYKDLQARPDFIVVEHPKPGDIVISPTGYGKGTGHVGIVGENGTIMSNNSFKDSDGVRGIFDQNYTIDSWRRRFVERGNFPMRFFGKI